MKAHTAMRRQKPIVRPPLSQRGAVLAISLIFLGVLSLAAMYTMRGSILGEQVSKNIRANEVARQAAETALRYCEDEVRRGSAAVIVNQASLALAPGAMPDEWQTRSNLFDDDKATTVPASQLAASGMRDLPVAPRCIVESYNLPPAPGEDPRSVGFLRPHLVTAVGFSPDYELGADDGPAISGSEVWLQSVVIL